MRSTVRSSALVGALGLSALAGTALSQNADPRDVPQVQLVFPVAGQDHKAEFVVVGKDGLVKPDHPPIHEIPPMPMPEYVDLDGIPGDDSVMFHDPSTGLTTVLPMRASSGAESGELAGFSGMFDDGMGEMQPENFGFMTVATGLTGYPRSPNCKLVMKFTDQANQLRYFVCSGSMNDAGVVLTAAHCVYARTADGPDIFDWADAIWIYPAWDGNGDTSDPVFTDRIQNFGWCTMSGVIAGSGYVNSGDWDRDVAAIRVDDRNIGMLTGWFGWSWGGCDTGTTHYNFSYPSEDCSATLHTGRTMYYWDGTFDSCPGNQLHLDTNSGCLGAVWGGMSGSGAYHISGSDRYVHAVCSTSNRSDSANYAKLWEQFTVDMESLKTSARGNTFDLELLNFRKGNATIQAGTSFSDATVNMINATNNNPAGRLVTIRVYMSTNTDISTSDTLLATWIYNLDFGPMHNYLASIPATTIPINTAPGNYFLGAILDSATDGNTANNDTDGWDCMPITVTLGLPDAPASPEPAHLSTGNPISSDLNWGNSARATSYDVYFGTDSTPDASEFQGNTASSAWSLPNLAFNTTYYWQIVARNTTGNVAGPVWRFTTQAAPADLNAIVANAPAGVYYRGQTLPYAYTVRNDGGTATGDYTVEHRLSINNIISTADTLFRTTGGRNLAAGAQSSVNGSGQIPPTINPGTYYYGIRVFPQLDPNSTSAIADTDTITIIACPADISGSSDPQDPTYGQPDGVIDAADFFYFLDQFAADNFAQADLTGSPDPQDPAYGQPDGVIDASDFFYFLDRFVAGCPGL